MKSSRFLIVEISKVFQMTFNFIFVIIINRHLKHAAIFLLTQFKNITIKGACSLINLETFIKIGGIKNTCCSWRLNNVIINIWKT